MARRHGRSSNKREVQMPQPIRITTVACCSFKVTERTEWYFLEVSDEGGSSEVVEITCGDLSTRAVDLVSEILSSSKDGTIADELNLVSMINGGIEGIHSDRALAAAVSGLRTAVIGLQARRDDFTLTEALGGKVQQSVHLYANINRSLLGGKRSPLDFAAAAERAAREGFTIVKCAPFDEAHPPATAAEVIPIVKLGLERVAAVRAAIGPQVRLLVDCHSRFEVHTAPLVAEELAKLDVGWFEEPIEPGDDPDGLAQISKTVSMLVAGGESGYGEEFFADLLKRKAVAVVMPDTKFCGGVGEASRIGRAAMSAGGQVSLHSPSGPVSQLASAHVTASVSGALPLEHAVYEADWRSDLMDPPERIEQGRFWFPQETGIGAKLSEETVRHRGNRRYIWGPHS